MSNFKIGEKIVFIGSNNPNKDAIYPKVNEIVTVMSYCNVHIGCIDILEYQKNVFGGLQSFETYNFRKLDHDFAENLLKEISEAMKSETILN